MALSALDPHTALILIDLQKGIVAFPTTHPIDDVLNHAGSLAEAFRRHARPVVLVHVEGGAPGRAEQKRSMKDLPSDFAELMPQLAQQPGDHLVTKHTWGAFTETGLATWLHDHGVTQVVIGGVSTSAGVESTARAAHELGFNVTLAIDAMTDTNADAHHNSIMRIFPRIGETGTTQEIVDLLQRVQG